MLGVGFDDLPALSNDPRFLTGIVPSANLVATANELTRFYQLLLQGGELDGVRVFDPRTVARATAEQTWMEFDRSLGMPIRASMNCVKIGSGSIRPGNRATWSTRAARRSEASFTMSRRW